MAFTPSGEVVAFEPFVSRSPSMPADGTSHLKNDSRAVADVIALKVAGIETATSNLSLMHPLLQCCAFDPERWCIVIIHAGALESVGPFRDLSNPLRDWLIRAARAGHSIGQPPPGLVFRMKPKAPKTPTVLLSLTDATLPLQANEASKSVVFPLPELIPDVDASETAWLKEHLEAFDATSLGPKVKSREDATALAAGVWQINGFLERSHQLAQSVEGKGANRAGDYWHAIMHRREPDYSNAKYWFRRVGQHGIHAFLARDADDILSACPSQQAAHWRKVLIRKGGPDWDPLAFIDLCEQLENEHDADLSLVARQIQFIEMVLLLQSTCHDAVGSHRLAAE